MTAVDVTSAPAGQDAPRREHPDPACAAAEPGRTWLSIPMIAGLLALAAGLLSRALLRDPDSYWHVAVGRWIIAHGSVPTADPFSFSHPGIPWTAHEWGSELLMAGLFDAYGWSGLQVVTALCFAATVAVLFRFLADRMEPLYAIVLGVLSVSLIMTHLLVRPHVLVWPLTVLWLYELFSASEARRRPTWWLVPLMALWANLHASFILGIGLGGLVALEAVFERTPAAERRAVFMRWALLFGACVLVTLANPRGIGAYTHAVGVMQLKETLNIVSEWRSANFHELKPFMIWLLVMLALAFTRRVALTPARLLMVIGVVYLALKHQRYHSLVGLVGPFALALPIARGMRGQPLAAGADASGLDRLLARAALPARSPAVLLCAALVAVCSAVALARMDAQPVTAHTPAKAVDAYYASGRRGRVFNGYNFGGYLIFRGVPVFVDGRGDMYGDSLIVEWDDAVAVRKDGALEGVLERYAIDWTLLNPQTPAVRVLDHLPGWQRFYADSVAVVHIRER